MLEYRIENVRSGGQYSVIGCDVALGYSANGTFVPQLMVKGVWLRERKESGHFVSWPSAVRIRDGKIVQEDGKNKYDNNVQLYGCEGGNPKKGNDWAITPEAWEFQETLVEELLKLAQAQEKVQGGRGSAKATGSARAAAPARPARAAAPARPARAAAPAPTPEEDDEYAGDSRPF